MVCYESLHIFELSLPLYEMAGVPAEFHFGRRARAHDRDRAAWPPHFARSAAEEPSRLEL